MVLAKVLIVDDQPEPLFVLQSLLEREGYEVVTASNGEEAITAALEQLPDVILLDVMMPGLSGKDVARTLKADEQLRYTPIVLLTSRDDLEVLEEGFAAGADDFLRRPFEARELLARVQAALRTRAIYAKLRAQRLENAELKKEFSQRHLLSQLLWVSRGMAEVNQLIDKVAKSALPVLITGETGTGKELVARALHERGDRKDNPFVIQNCSAFSEQLIESELFGYVKGAFTGANRDKPGLFQVADGGTFFLDEIGELPLTLQAKLLRVIQEGTFTPVGDTKPRKVDVRILAATHRNLPHMIAEGKFREDLYYRLNVINIATPALRDRPEDIPVLVKHFLARRNEPESKLSHKLLSILTGYSWPGNVRQLENEIERLILLSAGEDAISEQYLSPVIKAALSGAGDSHSKVAQVSGTATPSANVSQQINTTNLKQAIESVERQLIAQALKATAGNKSEASRLLGISRSSLIQKVQEYNLEADSSDL